MATTTIEKELVELETRYWQAMMDRDAGVAVKLTDEVCLLTGARGAFAVDRNDLATMLDDTSWEMHSFEIGDDAHVRLVNDDVAIVAYTVREKLTVEGKPVELKAADASTWVRRNGHWVCALHTESILGDPFGRDRRAD